VSRTSSVQKSYQSKWKGEHTT